MPALIAKHQEKITVTKLKKVYSQLSQAYLMAQQEHGDPTGWDLIGADSPDGALHALEHFAPYLNVTKNCGNAQGCFPNVNYTGLKASYIKGNLNNFDHIAKIILNDGTLLYFQANNDDCSQVLGSLISNNCGAVVVDINGFKPPNQQGNDLFFFYLTKNGIIPVVTKDDNGYSFSGTCNSNSHGAGCTSWVIYNENMDYLHCNGLSWDGPTKCD
jgi:hypothetical protein